MENFAILSSDEILDILYLTHPAQYIALYSIPQIKDVLDRYRYYLLKKWCVTDMNVTELSEYVPNITLQQMTLIANYWYPYNNYELYNPKQLFRNACRAEYTVDKCIELNNITPDGSSKDYNIITAYMNNRPDVLQQLGVTNIVSYLLEINNPAAVVSVLLNHQDVSIETFVNLVVEMRLYLSTALQHNRIIGSTTNPLIMQLLKDLDIVPPKGGYFSASLSLEKLLPEYIDKLNFKEYSEMSRLNSIKYPSYDLFDDIVSGNFIEVVHKANTWNRNITVKGFSLEPTTLEKKYTNVRNQTIGQVIYSTHPGEVRSYLGAHNCSPDGSEAYEVLHKWCFPDIPVEQLKREIDEKNAKLYAPIGEYLNPIGSNYGDPSLALLTALENGYNDTIVNKIINRFRGTASSKSRVNLFMICVKYGIQDLVPYYPRDELAGLISAYKPGDSVEHASKDVIYQVLNNAILSITEKLDFLGRIHIPQDLLYGLRGSPYKRNSNVMTLIGAILNAQANESDLVTILSPSKLFHKNTQDEIEDIVAQEVDHPDFPYSLAYYSTEVLHNLPEGRITKILSNINEYPIETRSAAINREEWYLALTLPGTLDRNRTHSKFGYVLELE